MDIIQIGVLGIVSAILILIIKANRPEIGLQISLAFGAIVMVSLAGKIGSILDLIDLYMTRANIDGIYIKSLIKIIGMAYITEFAAETCRDASQNAIGRKWSWQEKYDNDNCNSNYISHECYLNML